MSKRLLIVDDDNSMRSILQEALVGGAYDVKTAKDGESAIRFIDSNDVDLVITDLMMPGINGLELMMTVRKSYPELGFIFITAYGTVETAVKAMHEGAFDFITKPFSISQIETRVERYFNMENLRIENRELKQKLSLDQRFKKLVGKNTNFQKIFEQIDIVSKSDVPVLIQGESGTGKELIAGAIHEASNRSGGKYLKINCSAIPDTLFESTLFGHEKGAFTNAHKAHTGLFEEADGGTLLLDEISEMPALLQAKLLRVLQEGAISRVGSNKELAVDTRIIATTNRNIKEIVGGGKFRSDLFFRLNVFPIKVPPLRTRRDDIPVLVDHFMKKYQKKYGYSEKAVEPEVMEAFQNYYWPGNVRQLENILERAILYSMQSKSIKLADISFETEVSQNNSELGSDEVMSIPEMEKKLIIRTLKQTKNNRTEAARILEVSTRTLRNKLHQYEEESGPIEGVSG
ncbi:MAG: sigma-54-dependent Fis family transcriptional regulator [FCB group bacterium]|nr:sigma-54-dependent Fis family transcriptional regulator [FCB group bacterium]